jgi:competence protein ComEA
VPDHPLPDDAGDLDGPDDLLTRLRPPPPRTWRDRLDDLAADPPSPGRVVLALVVVAVVALVGWRVLAPPPAPPELTLPLAEPAQDAGAAGARAGAPGAEPAAIPGPADAPGGGGGDGDPAGTGATVSSAEVVVHVVGAVAAPGVQRLPTGSRVVDAVEAAGGAAPDADLSRVNLAAVLADGQQVVVLRPGEAPPAVIGAGPSGGTGAADDASGAAGAGNGAPVDVNRASAAELEELPGVGPATAEAIIAHREQSGPFATVDDLLDVRGIGEAKLEQLRHRVTV